VNDLSKGGDWPGLSQADTAMLSYARKLTVEASSIDENHIALLRGLGFSDRAILEINLATAYMNFVNRIAKGLGVELEASMQAFTR
jgi:alkylhydroperoxidase family enzyme